jgi:ABC-type glycerol-3-phosphate transport system substrate-binding protein
VLAACGVGGSSGNAEATKAAAPKAITYVKTASADAFDRAWQEWFDAAEKATGIKTTVVREPGVGFWDKRQQEYAGGTAPADFTYNQLNWFIVGGLRGMFVDHLPYYKRDKVDTSQFLKTEFESWMWKGKLWGISFQTGGEGVMLNKQIFQEKGVPLPGPSWTYDDLIQLSQRLNDPAKSIAGAEIGQNGIQYMAGTFMRNFGGKVLNDARNKAIYADDNSSVRGTEVNVDLHQKYKVTPTPQIAGLVPSGSSTFRAKMLAININYLGYVAALPDLGPGNIEVLPPPKGPTGLQTARVAGNAWSILSLSKAPESVWQVIKWMQSKEGTLKTTYFQTGIGWPVQLWAADAPEWIDQFKGTNIASLKKVWETAGHNQVVLPEGDVAIMTMNGPLNDALAGKLGPKEALTQSQNAVNALFAQRPREWEM